MLGNGNDLNTVCGYPAGVQASGFANLIRESEQLSAKVMFNLKAGGCLARIPCQSSVPCASHTRIRSHPLPCNRTFNFQPATSHSYTPRVTVLGYITLAICAYLLGSIPTGYLVARAKGIDIRAVGSGNIGATNAFRVLGKPAGIFVLLADAFKGFAACTILTNLLLKALGMASTPFEAAMTERVVAGIIAVLGHNFTCWLRFKGGKGIATTTGVYFAVAWQAALVAVLVWTIVLVFTRYVSLASIVAAVVLPTGVWLMIHVHHSIPLGIVTTAMGALAIWNHKANIARLKSGTENRMSFGRKPSEGSQA